MTFFLELQDPNHNEMNINITFRAFIDIWAGNIKREEQGKRGELQTGHAGRARIFYAEKAMKRAIICVKTAGKNAFGRKYAIWRETRVEAGNMQKRLAKAHPEGWLGLGGSNWPSSAIETDQTDTATSAVGWVRKDTGRQASKRLRFDQPASVGAAGQFYFRLVPLQKVNKNIPACQYLYRIAISLSIATRQRS